MALLTRLIDGHHRIVSVIGMAKNAGKTVTLNHLIATANSNGVTVGLTSIGRDGEAVDLVTSTAKPTIYVRRGTLVATAQPFVERASSRAELLTVTDIDTAMGRVIIAKVTYDGYIELAGPSTTAGIKQVCAELLKAGAELALIDGALDRRSLASPSNCDAAILATGAVLSRDMRHAVSLTAHRVMLFNLPMADHAVASLAKQSVGSYAVSYIDWETKCYISRDSQLKTALAAGAAIASQLRDATRYIVLAGGLSEGIVNDYLQVRGHLEDVTWLVQDATRIFISPRQWQYYCKRGLRIQVIWPIHLIGITYNPTAPAGYSYKGDEFKASLASVVPNLPIVDVMMEDVPWSF